MQSEWITFQRDRVMESRRPTDTQSSTPNYITGRSVATKRVHIRCVANQPETICTELSRRHRQLPYGCGIISEQCVRVGICFNWILELCLLSQYITVMFPVFFTHDIPVALTPASGPNVYPPRGPSSFKLCNRHECCVSASWARMCDIAGVRTEMKYVHIYSLIHYNKFYFRRIWYDSIRMQCMCAFKLINAFSLRVFVRISCFSLFAEICVCVRRIGADYCRRRRRNTHVQRTL